MGALPFRGYSQFFTTLIWAAFLFSEDDKGKISVEIFTQQLSSSLFLAKLIQQEFIKLVDQGVSMEFH